MPAGLGGGDAGAAGADYRGLGSGSAAHVRKSTRLRYLHFAKMAFLGEKSLTV
jgi:hypothetical protein